MHVELSRDELDVVLRGIDAALGRLVSQAQSEAGAGEMQRVVRAEIEALHKLRQRLHQVRQAGAGDTDAAPLELG